MASYTDHNHSVGDAVDRRQNFGNSGHPGAAEGEGGRRGNFREAAAEVADHGDGENGPGAARGPAIRQVAGRAGESRRFFAKSPGGGTGEVGEAEGADFGNRNCRNTDRNSSRRTRNLGVGLLGKFGVWRTHFGTSGVGRSRLKDPLGDLSP